ncbi:hypothetical protein O181_000130 [Austropuccinia psidii MF-1]|uniref:Uncharacterized protein n=1 Tax=Austropuccinia psidii MF-1 TaxID=1389203 RepID=A0A9Q3B8A5_9BASI|nr:hypothetical protein [Austropuccinia psidii MF-1]
MHLFCKLALCYCTPTSSHAHICFCNTTSESPLYNDLIDEFPFLISSEAYHAHAPALPSHVLNLISYAHSFICSCTISSSSQKADHSCSDTKYCLEKHLLQTSAAYHPKASTHPPHYLCNLPCLCSRIAL